MTDFKMVPVADIHPDPNQPRKLYDKTAMTELTASVKEKGVLQPILLRPNGEGYILVCGERRYRATKEAGLSEIPSIIKHLTDDEALELQIIENLQRKDVHPMEEAVAFKSMLDNKSKAYTLTDIAAKVNKPEGYISHRLSLNNLIPELQKEFFAGKFLVGHAVLFSKLSPEDQKSCAKDCKDWDKEYRSIKHVQDHITRNIMRVLSSAPFKKDDPTLNPAMGPCTTCPFKSGNNPTLFNEVKEDDRCFKPSCFSIKMENYTLRKVETILIEEPDIKLISVSHDKVRAEIVSKAKEYNVKILKDYDDFTTYAGGTTSKGLWVNGSNVGVIEKIYLRKSVSASPVKGEKPSNTAIDDEIAGIKQRTKRAAELDDEKVWKRIHDEVISDKELINSNSLSKVDTATLLMAIYRNIGFSDKYKIEKLFGTESDKTLAQKLLTATQDQVNKVFRIFFVAVIDSPTGSHSDPAKGLLKMVAEQYQKDKIAGFEAEQKDKRIKREERANIRIKGLQEQKKQVKVATPKQPAAKKAPSKKSTPKKTVKKKAKK